MRVSLPSWARTRWVRLGVPIALVATLLGTLTWFWAVSLLPSTYSVMDMGYHDYGGGPAAANGDHHHESDQRPVSSLTVGTDRPADVTVSLVARKEPFTLVSGRRVDGYTLNGSSPGPTIRARQGQLLEVRLRNESVPDGTTLHWHGLDVPNAMDGVAGVTQDAVGVGGEFVYRFLLEQAGTYWYHSHQVSHQQVIGGLFGALVVEPAIAGPPAQDVLALVHSYDGRRTVNGQDGGAPADAAPGTRVRARIINTDNGPMSAWVSGAPFQLAAVDGTDVRAPAEVSGRSVVVTAGGRADLLLTMPADGSTVRVIVGGSASLLLGSSPPDPGAAPVATGQPPEPLDLLTYGTPGPLGFDPAAADRRFDYRIGRRPGFLDGKPGLWWTINGHMFPNIPMYVVSDGDIVRMRITNSSGDVHPMHLHGHHAVVLSRNGVAATGSPWWVDSLNVLDGEEYEIAFRADNPGIWMDHCHNLPHAREGLVAHLMYTNVTGSYQVGGPPKNTPE